MVALAWLGLGTFACQWQGNGFLRSAPAPVSIEEVRHGLGMTATDAITSTHRIIVDGEYESAEGTGTFRRTYDPDGRFEARTHPEGGTVQVKRFDGSTLWIESSVDGSYPMTPAHARLASSIEWVLGGRWLAPDDSPFDTEFLRRRNPDEGTRVRLRLAPDDFESHVVLDPITLEPAELLLEQRKGDVRLALRDWQTRRGFPWPYRIEIYGPKGLQTTLRTTEVRFEPSLQAPKPVRRSWEQRSTTRFDRAAATKVPLRRTRSGHWLVQPELEGREVGWFLVDTGTGVNCLDPQALALVPGFLDDSETHTEPISIIGLGGQVEGALGLGGALRLGPMVADRMEWVALDLKGLEDVVGERLAGVLGGELFERAILEIDVEAREITLHNPSEYDGSHLSWHPLRFDGSTPCVQGTFAPDHEGWFRLDTGSDDTVTFHAPWVQKLSLTRRARNLVRMRLRGIGGEISAVQGRIRWFETLGQRFSSPRVTLVEQATGPLANPDLVGNLGVGFLENQRLILDYPNHRVTLIPR